VVVSTLVAVEAVLVQLAEPLLLVVLLLVMVVMAQLLRFLVHL